MFDNKHVRHEGRKGTASERWRSLAGSAGLRKQVEGPGRNQVRMRGNLDVKSSSCVCV